MRRKLTALLAATTATLTLATPAALAGPTSPQQVIVSLGDSFISGEAGRWQGNSTTNTGDRDGTDRAYNGFLSYKPERIYLDGTYDNDCHRSDVAEIRSAVVAPLSAVNLACSGAETKHVLRAQAGGEGFKTETPQGDRLVQVARDNDIQLIALSIGGNDLGFQDVIESCIKDYTFSRKKNADECHDDQQRAVAGRMAKAMSNVRLVIDDIRAIMTAAGYADTDYRFVLQSYPSPLPRGADARFEETGTARLSYGCPFWDVDLDWARGLVNQIANNLQAVADAENVHFLDLRDLFDGHEACAKTAVDGGTAPAAQLEWARYLSTGAFQGNKQESFHPNAVGQRALGECLKRTFIQLADTWACRAGAGVDPSAVSLVTIKETSPTKAPRQLDEHVDVAPDGEFDVPSPRQIKQAIDRRDG